MEFFQCCLYFFVSYSCSLPFSLYGFTNTQLTVKYTQGVSRYLLLFLRYLKIAEILQLRVSPTKVDYGHLITSGLWVLHGKIR